MGSGALEELLKEMTGWADSLVALGTSSMTEEQRGRGRRLVEELARGKMLVLSASVREFLDCERAGRAAALGRLMVRLELAREGMNIEKLRRPARGLEEMDLGEESESADAG